MAEKRVQKFIRNPKRALFTLAWPILMGMFVQTMYNIVDTAFVGRLGADSIAALTFAFPVFFFFIAMTAGVGAGISSRVARFMGENRRRDAESTSSHGIIIALLLALVLFAAGYPLAEGILSIVGAEGNVLELSTAYLRIILSGMFFMFPAFAINYTFQGQGDTKTPMKIHAGTLLLNIILDPVFIYVLGYGVKGAAMATVLSFMTGLAAFSFFIRRARVRPRLRGLRISLLRFYEIMKVGIPAALMMLIMSFYFTLLNNVMARFGTDYVAAFGMSARLESLAIMPIVAFSLALLALVGMFYGAGKYMLLKNTILYTMKLAVLASAGIGALIFIFTDMFFRIFTENLFLIGLGSAYMKINVFTLPLIAISITVSRALQGMGMGMPGLVINIVRVFVVSIPLAYIFVFLADMGYLSVAVAMVLGALVAVSVALTWLKVIIGRCERKA